LTLLCLGFALAIGNVTWLAAFTETAEAINDGVDRAAQPAARSSPLAGRCS
jgi:hypothetical protein